MQRVAAKSLAMTRRRSERLEMQPVSSTASAAPSVAAIWSYADEDNVEWDGRQTGAFWSSVMRCAREEYTGEPETTRWERDRVYFARFDIPALERLGEVTVDLVREGKCLDTVVMTFETAMIGGEACSYRAEAGKHFEKLTTQVTFAPGEWKKDFKIKIMKVGGWLPTRSFCVQLKEVNFGSVYFAGVGEGGVPMARIHILHDDTFPSGMPKLNKHTHMWTMFYFIKARILARKQQSWKTLFGYCAQPFHTVAVTSVRCDPAASPGSGWAKVWVVNVWFGPMGPKPHIDTIRSPGQASGANFGTESWSVRACFLVKAYPKRTRPGDRKQ